MQSTVLHYGTVSDLELIPRRQKEDPPQHPTVFSAQFLAVV